MCESQKRSRLIFRIVGKSFAVPCTDEQLGDTKSERLTRRPPGEIL